MRLHFSVSRYFQKKKKEKESNEKREKQTEHDRLWNIIKRMKYSIFFSLASVLLKRKARINIKSLIVSFAIFFAWFSFLFIFLFFGFVLHQTNTCHIIEAFYLRQYQQQTTNITSHYVRRSTKQQRFFLLFGSVFRVCAISIFSLLRLLFLRCLFMFLYFSFDFLLYSLVNSYLEILPRCKCVEIECRVKN